MGVQSIRNSRIKSPELLWETRPDPEVAVEKWAGKMEKNCGDSTCTV